MPKMPMGSLKSVEETPAKPVAKEAKGARGLVQTVRLSTDELTALKMAAIRLGVSQQEIIVAALRRDLGLE